MTVAEGKDVEKPFDPFELMTAILLGVTAIGAAVAGFQANQWGGRQLDAFAEANTLTTKASTQYNEDTVFMNADFQSVATAKEHLVEAREAKSGPDRAKHLELASFFYTTQLSHTAYKAMQLPERFYVPDEDDVHPATPAKPGAAPVPPPTTVAAAEVDEEKAPAGKHAPPAAAVEPEIPDDALMASLGTELDDEYATEMVAKGTKMFADADAKFSEGRKANDNGDKFQLVGVLFTVALFFAGLGLVFKTSVRWGFFTAGTLVFIGSTIYMATLPWVS